MALIDNSGLLCWESAGTDTWLTHEWILLVDVRRYDTELLELGALGLMIDSAMMGQLIHNWKYTKNDSLNEIITQALQFQVGENKDYRPKNWSAQLVWRSEK